MKPILVTFFLVYIIVLLYSFFSNLAPQGCKCALQNQLSVVNRQKMDTNRKAAVAGRRSAANHCAEFLQRHQHVFGW